MNKRTIFAFALLQLAAWSLASPLSAGGILGDAINAVAPGVGTKLDEAHAKVKEALPPYKKIEEGASNAVRETSVQSAAPVLEEWIRKSRDDAIKAGVKPIPPDIKRQLQGFFPEALLNKVRYRVGQGNELSLQANSFRFGDAAAITLGDVVVFKSSKDALTAHVLWAHEMTHVQQYEKWGIRDFSIRYLRNWHDVEDEAEGNASWYSVWYEKRQRELASANPSYSRPTFGGSSNQRNSSSCSTQAGVCVMPSAVPVGTACWCSSVWGPIYGSVR